MHTRRALAVTLALLVTLSSAGLLRSAFPRLSELQAHTQARLNDFQSVNGLPGATMAVVLPAGEEFVVAAGFSNIESLAMAAEKVLHHKLYDDIERSILRRESAHASRVARNGSWSAREDRQRR